MKINSFLILIIGAMLITAMIIIDNMIVKLLAGFVLLVLMSYLAELANKGK